ncbi:MAG: zf-HC2 domain-containing protein [Thermoanaerobaculia bacterium]
MTQEHDRYREWLDLEVDGSLADPERQALSRHLESCPECRAESAALAHVHAQLAAARRPVRDGFAHEVLRSLPAAPWEASAPRAWRAPLLLLLTLGGASAALLGRAAAGLEPHARFFGAIGALADLLQASLVAGLGLLGASWKGLGLGVAQWLAASKLNWVAAALLVVGVNYLLIRVVGARRRLPAERIASRR